MRPKTTPPVPIPATLIVVLLVAAPLATAGPAGAGPTPHESPVEYQAGWWNTTYVGGGTDTINVSMFYPAQWEGEDADRDTGGAPYPALLMVPGLKGRGLMYEHYRSYAVDLSQRGYIVLLDDLTRAPESQSPDFRRWANMSLEGLDLLASENGRSGSVLQGMVDTSSMAVAGHGDGGKVALMAALQDAGGRVSAVATLGLLDPVVDYRPSVRTGELDMPLHLQGGPGNNNQWGSDTVDAFDHKARGYVSMHEIAGANYTQFMDVPHPFLPSDWEAPAEINRSDQQNLSRRYLLAFLDRHLKGDALAAPKLYGDEARADLSTGLLSNWRYGVVDHAVEIVAPSPGAVMPTGPVVVRANVTNVGPFALAGRNVTLVVDRVVGGGNLVREYGPQNRTTGPLVGEATDEVSWDLLLPQYGDYLASVRMDDPDHNVTNNFANVRFTLSPLLRPTIDHEAPETLELGLPFNLSCTLGSTSGIAQALVNYTDEEGLTTLYNLTQDPGTGDWYVVIPPARSTGQVRYRLEVQGGNGAWNITNPYYIPVVDGRPPLVTHEPQWSSLPVLSQVEVEATVTDAGGVDQVRLVFTEPASGSHNVTCGRQGDRWFYPLVLGAQEGALVYTWYAVDTWGNHVEVGPFSVLLTDAGPPTIEVAEPTDVELGDPVVLSAKVTDDASVRFVWVTYSLPRRDDVVNGTPVILGDSWRLQIDGVLTVGTLYFQWGADDINGHVNVTSTTGVEVVDTVPPDITGIEVGNATVGPRPYVTAMVEDAGGIVRVQVDYIDVWGEDVTAPMERQADGAWRAALDPQTRGGLLYYKVVAEDREGNVVETSLRSVVVRDVDLPVISHSSPEDLVAGQEVTFTATVTDNVGVDQVWIYLKLTPASAFRREEMQRGGGEEWEYTLPSGLLIEPRVLYYFEAQDMLPSQNSVLAPPDAPEYAFIVNVSAREMAVYGTVKGVGGRPVVGASVHVQGLDLVVRTDANGSYRVPLSQGMWTVSVKARGYRTFEAEVNMDPDIGDRALDIALAPLEQADGDGDDGNTGLLVIVVILLVVAVLTVYLWWSQARRRG